MTVLEEALALLEGDEVTREQMRERLRWAEVCGLIPDGHTADSLLLVVGQDAYTPAGERSVRRRGSADRVGAREADAADADAVRGA